MKIAIAGAGFTGLSAAYQLLQQKHEVTLFEKERFAGGLAASFRLNDWDAALEMHYHHWFSNDKYALSLIAKLGLAKDLIFPKSRTSVFYENCLYPLNSAPDVLSFSPINPVERLRLGMVLLLLKLIPSPLAVNLEKYTAYEWLEKYLGKKTFDILWKPLFIGKFGPFARSVNMAWFWARIKKRTPRLGYLTGGYERLTKALITRIRKQGGKILLGVPFDSHKRQGFDAVIITTPSPVFIKMFPELPASYKHRLMSISHLQALNLVLITREKFLSDTYWLNINDRKFPFVGIIQHTNLVEARYYGGQHITWIANYLPDNHPYLKMTKEELFKVYLPYLQKINPSFNLQHFGSAQCKPTTYLPRRQAGNLQLFIGSFAQPVFPVNYSKIKPDFQTPIQGVYLANMDMVYPWDRGTNYAIELGYKAAEIVLPQYQTSQTGRYGVSTPRLEPLGKKPLTTVGGVSQSKTI